MLKKNSKLNTIELPINRGFLYEKKDRTLGEKTLPILCKNRESSLKFTRIPLFINAYSYFFQLKWGSFKLVRDQANGLRIESSTFNYSFNLLTSKHDLRSSFIIPSDRKVSWRSNQRNLLYYFIVKIHAEDYTHIYTNQIQVDYLLHYFIIVWFIIYENCMYKPQRSKDFGVKRKRNQIGLNGNGLAVVGSMRERERYAAFKNAISVDLAWNSTFEVELESLSFKKNIFI